MCLDNVGWTDLAQERKKQAEDKLVPKYNPTSLEQVFSDFWKERHAFMSTNLD